MAHSHEQQDAWSSLSSVDSLADLSVPPPPSKSGFRRLSARTAADVASLGSATAGMAERSHKLPAETDIKAERYRYVPPDREVWRPAIEQLSQKIADQQHELWQLQDKLRAEAHHGDELLRVLKHERTERREVVAALTAQLSSRREHEEAAHAETAARQARELEQAWKRCAELEEQRKLAREDAEARKQESAALSAQVDEMQTQIAGLKLLAAQPQTAPETAQSAAAASDLQHENSQLRDSNARLAGDVESARASAAALADEKRQLCDELEALRASLRAANDGTDLMRTAMAALKNENAHLKNEVDALQTASRASRGDSDSLRESAASLKKENEALRSANADVEAANAALKASLEAHTQQAAQQMAAKLKHQEEDIWRQASQLAADHAAQAVKRADTETARLNDKVQSQAAIIASQKEFVAMANSQLDYMRGLLGESIGKILDRRPSHHHLGQLDPYLLRPSPPPQPFSLHTPSQRSTDDPRSRSKSQTHSAEPVSNQPDAVSTELRAEPRAEPRAERTKPRTRPQAAMPQVEPRAASAPQPPISRPVSPKQPPYSSHAGRVRTPPPPSREAEPELEPDASSSDSLSTIQPDSDPHSGSQEWAPPTRGNAAYPLQQSTMMNHSTTTASSTSTPGSAASRPGAAMLRTDNDVSFRPHDDNYSFLDALYERLAQGKLSREELEDLESIYDAREEILAERPKLELDAKALLASWRQNKIPHRHAAVVSRIADDLA